MNLLAGGSLGALVGLLLGLSASPTVSATVGSLVAAVVAFFGLGGTAGRFSASVGTARIAAFSVAMMLAVLAGVAIRSHGLLSPSAAARVASWRAAGFDEARARELAAFELTGVLPAGATRSGGAAPPPTATILFSEEGKGDCSVLEADRFTTPEDRLRAMIDSGPPWNALRGVAGGGNAARLGGMLDGAWALVCSGGASAP